MIRRPDATSMADEIMSRLDDFASSLTPREAAAGFQLEDIFVRAGITATARDSVFSPWNGLVKDYLRRCGWKRRMLTWYPPAFAAPARPTLLQPESRPELPEPMRRDLPALQPAQRKMSYRELLSSRKGTESRAPQLPPGSNDNPTELH